MTREGSGDLLLLVSPVHNCGRGGGLLSLVRGKEEYILFFMYENIVFPAQAEYYLSADFRLEMLLQISLNYSL